LNVILPSLSCCIWIHVSTPSRHLKEALSLHKSIMLSMAWEIGLGLGPPPVFPCSCLWFVNTFFSSFFQIVPFFFDFIWGPNGNSQWAGLVSYLSPYSFLFICDYIWVLWIYVGVIFSTSLCIKTISSLLKLHFFSLFLSWEGGLSQPYIFFYLSAARIEQGIVGYIGLG
jgi:hypothetical protein